MFLGVYEETNSTGTIKRTINFECSGNHILERYRQRFLNDERLPDSYVAEFLMGNLERQLLNEEGLMYVIPEISKGFFGKRTQIMDTFTKTDRYVSPSFVFFNEDGEGHAMEVTIEQVQVTSKKSAKITLKVDVNLRTYYPSLNMRMAKGEYVIRNFGNGELRIGQFNGKDVEYCD